MSKTELKREKFARVRYNGQDDSFILELYDDTSDEWVFSVSARCQRGDHETDEAEYIHFSFLNEVLKTARLGWTFV